MSDLSEQLEEMDYDYFMNKALSQIPDGIDKREGSIIYDALAPACYQLAEFVFTLNNILLEAFVQTATGKYLDYRAEENGLTRILATKAVAKAKFVGHNDIPYSVPIGSRFSSIGDNPIYYAVTEEISPGTYYIESEQVGTENNKYVGELLPLDNFNSLVSATLLSIDITARDDETDDDLRKRILNTKDIVSFGGNIKDYINFTSSLEGVGAVQIYPVWQGGGTVKVVLLDSEYNVPSPTLIEKVQTAIDPQGTQNGYGLAPIGHSVTVAGPTNKNINISMHVDIEVGNRLDLIKPLIQKALEEHFLSIRKNWSNHNDLYQYSQVVYRSQIIAALLKVSGVANVSNLRLNNADADVTLKMDNTAQECAFLGSVSYV